MSASVSSSIELLLQDFRQFIVGIVKASELVPHLAAILEFSQNTANTIIEEPNQSKAMWKLLEIIDQCDIKGKWPAFVLALKAAGYRYVADILEGKQVSANHDDYIKIIQLFYPDLQKSINPIEILPELISTDVIDDKDMQAIEARQEQSGAMAASLVLLDRIPRRLQPEQWYNRFLQALWNSGQEDLVKQIDPDFVSRYTSWILKSKSKELSELEAAAKKGFADNVSGEHLSLESLSISDDDMLFSFGSVKEDFMEVSGDSEMPDNNFSPPPDLSKCLPSQEKQQKPNIVGLSDPSKPAQLQKSNSNIATVSPMMPKKDESPSAVDDMEKMHYRRAKSDSGVTSVKRVYTETENNLNLPDEEKALNIPTISGSPGMQPDSVVQYNMTNRDRFGENSLDKDEDEEEDEPLSSEYESDEENDETCIKPIISK